MFPNITIPYLFVHLESGDDTHVGRIIWVKIHSRHLLNCVLLNQGDELRGRVMVMFYTGVALLYTNTYEYIRPCVSLFLLMNVH